MLAVARHGGGGDERLVAEVFGSPGDGDEHRFFDVEAAEHRLDDLLVGAAGGAQPEHLRALGVQHAQPQPPVFLARGLVAAGGAEFLPGRIGAAQGARAQVVEGLGGRVRLGVGLDAV